MTPRILGSDKHQVPHDQDAICLKDVSKSQDQDTSVTVPPLEIAEGPSSEDMGAASADAEAMASPGRPALVELEEATPVASEAAAETPAPAPEEPEDAAAYGVRHSNSAQELNSPVA